MASRELYSAVDEADVVTHSIGMAAIWGVSANRIVAFAPPFQYPPNESVVSSVNPDPREHPFDDDPDAVNIAIAAGRHGIPVSLVIPRDDEYYQLTSQREITARAAGINILRILGTHYDFASHPAEALLQSGFKDLISKQR